MARKKITPASTGVSADLQQSLAGAADQVLTGLEAAILDRAEERLFNFFLGGGFTAQLGERMAPHLNEFVSQVSISSGDQPSTQSHFVSLGSGDDAIEVHADDV